MARRFTEEEDNIILENAPNMTADELVSLLPSDRSIQSIYQRSYKLGVRVKKAERDNAWSTDETKIIMENGAQGYPRLAELLPHRGIKAIRERARLLGIVVKKIYTYDRPERIEVPKGKQAQSFITRTWTANEIKVLRRYSGMAMPELCMLLPNHAAEQISRMKSRLAL